MTIEMAKRKYPLKSIVYFHNYHKVGVKAMVVGYEEFNFIRTCANVKVYYSPYPGMTITKSINPSWIYRVEKGEADEEPK